MRLSLFIAFLFYAVLLSAQGSVTRDIKSFGAKGDGITDDHAAFQRAASFFNQRGGNGRLIISKGTYLVGKQSFNRNTQKGPAYEGEDLLRFVDVKNLVIEGVNEPVIRYRSGLRFGSFHPKTGKAFEAPLNFYDYTHAAIIKNAIELQNCERVTIHNLELDGNSSTIVLGGTWGDMGRQLPHSGLVIYNSTEINCTNLNIHHFGLDGMILSNASGGQKKKDRITVSNSRFEYNARQGLSWVGGNDLTVIKSGFNHTGKGKFVSAPGAGVDIEAEVGTVSNGRFTDCQFINNTGCGLVADSGPSSDCQFVNCLFWGIDLWSAWVRKPRFSFEGCTFHGSFVHGFPATEKADATVFRNCRFEDKAYNGKEPYGKYLIESNNATYMRLENCEIIAHKKNLFWLLAPDNSSTEAKYQIINCRLVYEHDGLGMNNSVRLVNTRFELTHPVTKKKTYFHAGTNGNVKEL